MPSQPTVSVILPVYNDGEALARCLARLSLQTFPASRTEVLVVDNGSDEDLGPVVAHHLPSARLLQEPRPGSYAARNRGLEEATGGVLAFTDADCLPEPEWLERGVACLMGDEGLGLVAGRVELFARDPERPTGAELYDMAYSLRQQDYVDNQHFGVTANLFTRRTVVDQVGPFNAALKSRGDFEWGRRVWDAGLRQAYCPDAVVRHPARGTLRELATKARRLRGGRIAGGELPTAPRDVAHRCARLLMPPRNLGPTLRDLERRHGKLGAARFYAAFYVGRLATVAEEVRLALGGSSRR